MLKNRFAFAVIVLAFAVIVAGCGGNSNNEESAPPPAETAEIVQENLSSFQLAGTVWELESFGGEDDLVPALPEVRSTVNYLVERYVGTGGCNYFLGVYNVEGDELTNATPATTRLACQDPAGVMDQESTFLSSLLNTIRFELTDDKLYMYTTGDQRLMTLIPAERVPLQGTVWSLRFIFANGEFQPLLPETTVTAQSDGEMLTGNAGCNDYTATLIREGDTVKVGEITVGDETCESPENIMVQEEDYLAALQQAASVEELASAVFLYDEAKAPLLLYGTQ